MPRTVRFRNFAATAFALLLLSGASAGGQAREPARIGTLFSGSPATHGQYIHWFQEGLTGLGYVEGRDYVLESRWGMGKRKRIRRMAAELARSGVDVIFVNGGTVVKAVGTATRSIPIVVGSAGLLGTYGFVADFVRPGGNVTGSTSISHDLAGKRLHLLKQLLPGVRRVAYVFTSRRTSSPKLVETVAAGAAMQLEVRSYPVENLEEMERAFGEMKAARADVILSGGGRAAFYYRKRLFAFANSMKLPTICERIEMAQAGCLMAYAPDRTHQMRRAAYFVDRILKGAKPGDLPIEFPTKFRLVINLKAARGLGIGVPSEILLQATEVIE